MMLFMFALLPNRTTVSSNLYNLPSPRNMQRLNLQFGLINIRSAVKKAASIHTLFTHDDLDVLALRYIDSC